MENNKKIELINNIEIKTIESFSPDSRVYMINEVIENDEIFIHGGANKKKEYSQIDIFDGENLKWKSAAEISTVDPFFIFDKPLSGHSSNYIKKKNIIVIYGGYDGISYSNAIYLIETDNYQFRQVDVRGKAGSEYPLPRCYHTSNYDDVGDSLYIFGGWNGAVYSQNFFSLWKFDFQSLTWENIILKEDKNESQISFRGHTSNKWGNKLILYGGVSGFNKYNDKLYEISLQVFFHIIFMIKKSSKFKRLREIYHLQEPFIALCF